MAEPFDVLMGSMDPAMVIVTAAHQGGRSGCLVGFHSQVSIEPLRYGVWISRANHTYPVAVAASHLAVHVLGADQRALAHLFGATTGDDTDKFARCRWAEGPGGVPVLLDCPAHMVVRRIDVVDDGGDHVGIITEPIAFGSAEPVAPMRLAAVEDMEPGHPAGDPPAGG
ncbi:flavin reductase family protein [Aquihabitans sp. McL0605]|uniref:flavin reductase family protein n=1 Tax=Aquihabitans sp. McL0605 TaxID=3415671 RepID=UPI003CEE9865